jgi:four helix bundle protein
MRHAPCCRMTPKELKDRTKRFAVDVVCLARELPNTLDGRRIGQQFLDAGTSVAANYRSTCRARSRAEFIEKMGIVEEESDETLFWLELMVDSKLLTHQRADKLMKEADELTAIFVASIKTAKR